MWYHRLMARALRIEGTGFWYHVMCRGNGGQPVYADKKDREAFLKRLGTVAAAVHVEIHAYAQMGNHLHLIVRTREIEKEMGGVSGGAVSMACRGGASRTKRDKHLRRIVSMLS